METLGLASKLLNYSVYASNATFTINLLHSVVGVDYFNILQSPLNGVELLNYFNNAF